MKKENFKKYLLIGLGAVVLIIPVSAIAFYGGVKMAPYMRGPGFFREEFKQQDNFKGQFQEAHEFMKQKPTPEMQEMFLKRGQEFLGNNADLQNKMIGKLEERIKNSPHLDEAEKDKMIKEMKKEMEFFGSLQKQAPNFKLEDFKARGPEIKEHWQNMNGNIKELSGKMLEGRMNDVFKKGQNLKDDLDQKIFELEKSGKDVAKLKEMQADLTEKMNQAKEQLEQAKEKYQSAENVEDMSVLMQEIHEHMQQGHEYLEEGRELFREMMDEMQKD